MNLCVVVRLEGASVAATMVVLLDGGGVAATVERRVVWLPVLLELVVRIVVLGAELLPVCESGCDLIVLAGLGIVMTSVAVVSEAEVVSGTVVVTSGAVVVEAAGEAVVTSKVVLLERRVVDGK